MGECIGSNYDDKWNVDIKIYNKYVKFKVDTGADITILNYSSYMKSLAKCVIHPCNKTLSTPAGKLKNLGIVKHKLKYKRSSAVEEIYILAQEFKTNNFLSGSAAEALNIVKFIGNISVNDSLFGFGKWDTEPVKLHVKADVVHHAIYCARNVPFGIRDKAKEALDKQVRDDIIEPVNEPTEWCSAMVPVIKFDKSSVRICVDFRKLNMSPKREIYHIPTFEELSYKLAGVTVMSKLDAASGFYQIPLDEYSRAFTSFLTPFGRYRYKHLPMGINCAPEIYQRKMMELLHGIAR